MNRKVKNLPNDVTRTDNIHKNKTDVSDSLRIAGIRTSKVFSKELYKEIECVVLSFRNTHVFFLDICLYYIINIERLKSTFL